MFGIGNEFFAALQIPFAPGRNHLNLGIAGIIAKLKAHLVIALAGRAMTYRIGAGGGGNFNLPFGDKRPRNGGAEQINAFIKRIGAKHREDIIADKFLAQVFDENLFNAQHFGFGPRRFQLFTLTQIGGEGHDLAGIDVLQPFQND